MTIVTLFTCISFLLNRKYNYCGIHSSQHLMWIKKVNQSCPKTRTGIVLVLGQL